MKSSNVFVGLLLASMSSLCVGQGERVLKGREVNEAALVDALLPASKPLTRSIRITSERDSQANAAKRPSASMLITFETNSAELTPRAKQMVGTLGRALQSDKLAEFKFSIEGHADPRGGEQFNLQLSQLRAESVVSYLSENQRIDRSRLKPIGKGQSELLNTDRPDAPENRRVTVKDTRGMSAMLLPIGWTREHCFFQLVSSIENLAAP